MKIIFIYLFTFSIAVFLIAAHYGYGIWNIGMHSPVSSVKASQYKFLTEMIFCFLNLSLCYGGILQRHKKVKGPIFIRAADPVYYLLAISPDISQQYIASGPFIKKFLFVEWDSPRRAIWCGLDTRSCWSRDNIISFLRPH